MINLILTGAAGRMGQTVLKILPTFKNIQLVAKVELADDLAKMLKNASVVVDFTNAEASVANAVIAASKKIPIVIGSTGHNESQRTEIVSLSKIVPIVLSPNMSVGVNVMWKLLEDAAKTLGEDYKINIVETHHVHKKDAPSGTAKKMMEILLKAGFKARVRSIREGEVVGDHTITFASTYESLEITHRAFSREVFAVGALRAAVFIVDKPAGLYDMEDVLKIKQ